MWDWPYIIYAGKTLLGYSLDEVWLLTPRFLFSQMKVHSYVQSQMWGGSTDNNAVAKPSSKKQTTGFIDQIPGWG